MTVPDYQTLMLPLLRHAAKKSVSVIDVEQAIADEFGLSEDEREQLLESGRQRVLHSRLSWAKTYMAKAGLLVAEKRGVYTATTAGHELLSQNPTRIDVSVLRGYPPFEDFYGSSRKAGDAAQKGDILPVEIAIEKTPEEQIESAYAVLRKTLSSEIVQRTLQSPPSFFEQLIIDLLVAMGYGGTHKNAARQLGKSGDGGVDGVINEDRLGLDRVYIQAKRYSVENTVGRPEVQAFVGSLVGRSATKGVFVTTSSFSAQATSFVEHLTQRVILINGSQLADLMIEHGVGVRTARTVEIKRLDEDFFSQED